MRAIVTSSAGPTSALFTFAGHSLQAALGRGGIRADKIEGDGATPLGVLPLRRVLYRPDRELPPRCAVPVQPIAPQDGWCDDPALPEYNQPVRLPIAGSAESLWRQDAIYDIIGVLGWNDAPVHPGLGSAIFLHLARETYSPTDGCIALSRSDLLHVLALGLTTIVVKT